MKNSHLMRLSRYLIVFSFGISSLITQANASDTLREAAYADALVDDIVVGDAQWLDGANGKFLAIFAESELEDEQSHGAVLLLHGFGSHPDQAAVIHPLRVSLPEAGWATLSLQMPIPFRGDTFDVYPDLLPEAPVRIQAGIKFLQDAGAEIIMLVGHSFGSLMATYYLAQTPDAPVDGIVVIGLPGEKRSDKLDAPTFIESISIPMLDLYGSEDLPSVTDSARQRAQAARKAGNKNYRQTKIPGADHFFQDMDATLNGRTRSWLHKHKPDLEQMEEDSDEDAAE